MLHLELFSSSISNGANTFLQLNYVTADALLPSQANGLTVISDLPYLHSVMGVGAHLTHVRAQANSMLPMPYITIDPTNRGSAFESPPRIWDISANPRPLRVTEEFDIFAAQNNSGSETEYVAAQFSDRPTLRARPRSPQAHGRSASSLSTRPCPQAPMRSSAHASFRPPPYSGVFTPPPGRNGARAESACKPTIRWTLGDSVLSPGAAKSSRPGGAG
jgi:hypothetical protein